MTKRNWCLGAMLGCLLAAHCTAPRILPAVEPVEEFIEALRRRQMFDVGQSYLEALQTSSLIDDKQRRMIPYEQARLLVDESRTLRDVNRRQELLETAQQKFEQFVNENSAHPLVASAKNEMGNVLVERGRTAWDKSQRPVNAGQKEEFVTEARKWFEQARQVFDEAGTQFEQELKGYPTYIDQKETELAAARNRALVNAIQARLLAGTVVFELAKTYATEDKQRTDMLQQATAQFASIYEKHQRRLAGLYARMWQGRCHQELGDTKQALSYYGELLAQPDEPAELIVSKRRTLPLAMLCWLTESEAKFDEVARQGTAWLAQARGNEAQTPEGLAIQYHTADAIDRRAQSLEARDGQRGRDLRDAARLAAEVARFPATIRMTPNVCWHACEMSNPMDYRPHLPMVDQRSSGPDRMTIAQTNPSRGAHKPMPRRFVGPKRTRRGTGRGHGQLSAGRRALRR